MFGLLKKTSKERCVPEGQRVYAIGDIHGRLDLLKKLADKIREDKNSSESLETIEVYLGDYIDRGQDSRGVIDWLTTEPKICDQRVLLSGNHELYPVSFLTDSSVYTHWKHLGGRETLGSYGVHVPLRSQDEDLETLQKQFVAKFANTHLEFLQSLENSFSLGDYFFVHAGARPGVPLHKQKQDDLLWIRDDFLNSSFDFGKIIVHGHTPVKDPEVKTNRINIDTGAFATHKLTCLVLEGSDKRFIHT